MLLILTVLFVGVSRAGYEPVLSKQLLYLASATFCDENSVGSWTCGPAC